MTIVLLADAFAPGIDDMSTDDLLNQPQVALDNWNDISPATKEELFLKDMSKFNEKADEYFSEKWGTNINGLAKVSGITYNGNTLTNGPGSLSKDALTSNIISVTALPQGGFTFVTSKSFVIQVESGSIDGDLRLDSGEHFVPGASGNIIIREDSIELSPGSSIEGDNYRVQAQERVVIELGASTIVTGKFSGALQVLGDEHLFESGKKIAFNDQSFLCSECKMTQGTKTIDGHFFRDASGYLLHTKDNKHATLKDGDITVTSVGHPLLVAAHPDAESANMVYYGDGAVESNGKVQVEQEGRFSYKSKGDPEAEFSIDDQGMIEAHGRSDLRTRDFSFQTDKDDTSFFYWLDGDGEHVILDKDSDGTIGLFQKKVKASHISGVGEKDMPINMEFLKVNGEVVLFDPSLIQSLKEIAGIQNGIVEPEWWITDLLVATEVQVGNRQLIIDEALSAHLLSEDGETTYIDPFSTSKVFGDLVQGHMMSDALQRKLAGLTKSDYNVGDTLTYQDTDENLLSANVIAVRENEYDLDTTGDGKVDKTIPIIAVEEELFGEGILRYIHKEITQTARGVRSIMREFGVLSDAPSGVTAYSINAIPLDSLHIVDELPNILDDSSSFEINYKKGPFISDGLEFEDGEKITLITGHHRPQGSLLEDQRIYGKQGDYYLRDLPQDSDSIYFSACETAPIYDGDDDKIRDYWNQYSEKVSFVLGHGVVAPSIDDGIVHALSPQVMQLKQEGRYEEYANEVLNAYQDSAFEGSGRLGMWTTATYEIAKYFPGTQARYYPILIFEKKDGNLLYFDLDNRDGVEIKMKK